MPPAATKPAPSAEPPPQSAPMQMEHSGHPMAMTGALGPYPMTRESSGTAWQPDASDHAALHVMSGDWTLMAHGMLNLVYDHQSGRRGDDKAFASGMLMGMARRPLGNGTLQLKAMVSPDPLMGKSGYPLLLASGETANGTDRLIDRQHPHDLFMELSASVSQTIGPNSSVFVYAGLPGEPAFGPPAFMHREAIMDSPEAPISHHWLDSTAYQLRRDHRRHRARSGQGRGQPLQRARARPASLEHRNRAARFNLGPGVVEPDADARAAGQLGALHRPGAARARRRPEAAFGEPALRARDCSGLEARGDARVGPKDGRAPQRRCVRRRSVGEAWRLDPVRARRNDREPRADRASRTGPHIGSARRRWARCAISGLPIIGRSAAAAWSRSTSCPMRWRRCTGATIRSVRWRSCG